MAIPCGDADGYNTENVAYVRETLLFLPTLVPETWRGLPHQSADWFAMTCVLFGVSQNETIVYQLYNSYSGAVGS